MTLHHPIHEERSDPGRRCRIISLARFTDGRGSLLVGELGAGMPFPVERFFLVVDAPDTATRGGHANRFSHELLVAVRGEIIIEVDEGQGPREVLLDRPDIGLHLPPLVWSTQRFGPHATLLVLASTVFDEADHIYELPELERLRGATRNPGAGNGAGDAAQRLGGGPVG